MGYVVQRVRVRKAVQLKDGGQWGNKDESRVGEEGEKLSSSCQAKAEPGVIMKSGWVESGRRTTLVCHLFGRCAGAIALGKRSGVMSSSRYLSRR